MQKTLRFYTEEEKDLLKQFAESQLPINKKLIGQFCKKYKRSEHSAMLKIYDIRKKLGIISSRSKTVTPKANLVKDNSAKMSKGEFKIPVNNWNMTNENGQLYLVVKF